MYNLYAIYDKVACSYGEPFVAPSDAVAVRRFNYTAGNAKMVALDLSLYKVAGYDVNSGVVTPDLQFVCNYEVIDNG